MYMFYMYICTIYILYKASEKKRNVCNLNKFYFIHICIYIYILIYNFRNFILLLCIVFKGTSLVCVFLITVLNLVEE